MASVVIDVSSIGALVIGEMQGDETTKPEVFEIQCLQLLHYIL
ncbi:MAG: hypothetical protein ACJAQS_000664 [Porticoccus sp.]|jgi:hypothetical protein